MLSREDKEYIDKDIYSNKLFIELRDNKPNFAKDEIKKGSEGIFEEYSEMDKLGRCGVAFACFVGVESASGNNLKFKSRMKPTAWKSIGCDCIEDGKCLYNRCHLIGRQLAVDKVSKKGLITGTRKFNIEGMFKYENEVANYIESNPNHHILYRVTPYFKENNLLAYGVQMEILDIDDEENLSYNIFVYNKQPNFIINYRNGDVYSDKILSLSGKRLGYNIYVIDKDTYRFHKESCVNVCGIKNKWYFVGEKQFLGKEYCECKICFS